MKILEAQSAVLTNFEVYSFIKRQSKKSGPPSLQTLREELIKYFESHPGPLSQRPITYKDSSIPKLLERLRKYEITKGEMIMIFNLRPTTIITLNTVIEDMEDRFTEEQQQDIVEGIVEVLGEFPPTEEAEEEGDAMDMTEAAQ
ncbi:RNA polymerase III subunit C17 [Pseudomassariella vexata]|uniref:DNA-directed RNA polymerase III subunit RPC9 n=1 Tax=Pseudomassariella vexata TaxID=1141098 RepID=A0A1Y2D7A5_9PEZI|nr:RNA polymerase III subunit C17 [Pseudomassariella vexata]ORY55087.1 RNA polymerase III subunit C17 [Pseudomassariella vexata]